MGIYFAKLMGNIKEIEISFLNLSEEFDKKFTIYDETVKELIKNLDNLFTQSEQQPIHDKKITEIKENFKNIFQIHKKELEIPLKSIKKNLDQIENHLNKIIEKIKSYNEKSQRESKTIINPEENTTLNNDIIKLSSQINTQKQQLYSLFDNLSVAQDKINIIKQLIVQYDYKKEEAKLIKQISDFINKLQSAEYVFTPQTDLLLEQLEILKTSIMQFKIITDQNNTLSIQSEDQTNPIPAIPLLTQFELGLTVHKTDNLDSKIKLESIESIQESHLSSNSPKTSPRP